MKHVKAPIRRGYWLSRIGQCYGKPQLWGIFGHFPVAESAKRHIYTPGPFICAHSHVYTTIRYKARQPGKPHASRNRCFFYIFAEIGHFRWFFLVKIVRKGTSTRQILLNEPICRSLRPFVTKKQPKKVQVSKNRWFWIFWPNLAISGGQNCQKAHVQATTFHMSLFSGLYGHPLQRYTLEKNR